VFAISRWVKDKPPQVVNVELHQGRFIPHEPILGLISRPAKT
jgi:hypothetical protein